MTRRHQGGSPAFRLAVLGLAAALTWPAPVGAAAADTADEGTWGTEISAETGRAGRVLAVAASNGTVYLGGDFRHMSPPGSEDDADLVPRDHLAALADGGTRLTDWDPGADKEVRALAVSADGRRVYAGGMFKKIGGNPAGRLAAIDATTGTLDPTFEPPTPDAVVRTLALSPDGRVLYVGGDFAQLTAADGTAEARPHLAALDAATGRLLDWIPPKDAGGRYHGNRGVRDESRPGGVHAILPSADGTTVHAGGSFLSFGGRSGLVSLDAATGKPTPWQAELDRPVWGLTRSRDGHTFYAATGGTGGRLIAFKPHGPPEGLWNVKTDGDAMSVVETESTVYLIGHYDNIVQPESDCYQFCPDGTARAHLSAFDRSGKIIDWAPSANTPTGPYTAVADANHLYIAGEFTKINGVRRVGFAVFSGVP